MSHRKVPFHQIAESVRNSFHDFALKRATDDPGFLQRMKKDGRWKAEISRLFAFLPARGSMIAGKKYVFLSARYEQLISRFNRDEAAMVAGPNDIAFAKRSKLPFRFTGDLLAVSGNLLLGSGWIPRRLVIGRWMRFFLRQRNPCYLVVPNDTLPIALLLVKIAQQCRNVRVVCIQHGLFNSGFEHDDIEGRNSAINLVYCDAQRREMERRLPGALVEVMGLPAEFGFSASEATQVRRVVLVGTGTLDDHSGYKIALQVYGKVRSQLELAGFQVEYRPHPSEKGIDIGKDAFRPNLDSKQALLNGERKVFVGFNSTLLYEAHVAGHIVIILNDAALPGYSISDFGDKLDTIHLQKLAEIIRTRTWEPVGQADVLNIRKRFEQALGRATERLARNTTDASE